MKRKRSLPGIIFVASLVLSSYAGAQADKDATQIKAETLPAGSILIEALIDGQSELRIKKDAVYWLQHGNPAKPGRHHGNEPTYVNEKPWMPVWKKHNEGRGPDKSNTHTLSPPVDPSNLELKLITVTLARGATGIDPRDPIKVTSAGDELSILIPDGKPGSRWYKFALVPKK